LCLFSPHWRVGWRFVDDGGVWKSHTLAGAPWNDIADPGFRFYADPFPYTFGGKTFVFVEEFDHRDGKGAISAIPFDERGQIGPAKSVLSEPWHLSYPFLFEYRGEVWMIPESSEDKKISLYRADPFHRSGLSRSILSTTQMRTTQVCSNSRASGGFLQRSGMNLVEQWIVCRFFSPMSFLDLGQPIHEIRF
jgi:hypothetical protein